MTIIRTLALALLATVSAAATQAASFFPVVPTSEAFSFDALVSQTSANDVAKLSYSDTGFAFNASVDIDAVNSTTLSTDNNFLSTLPGFDLTGQHEAASLENGALHLLVSVTGGADQSAVTPFLILSIAPYAGYSADIFDPLATVAAFNTQVVPLPTALPLLGGGLALLAAVARRRA